MDVQLWAMHKNRHRGHDTLISNTFRYVNGLNATSSSSIGLTHPSTCPTTSPNLYKHYSSTDTLTSSSTYSPVYSTLVGSYSNHTIDVDKFTPHSFTTPLTAAAARVYAPLKAVTSGRSRRSTRPTAPDGSSTAMAQRLPDGKGQCDGSWTARDGASTAAMDREHKGNGQRWMAQ